MMIEHGTVTSGERGTRGSGTAVASAMFNATSVRIRDISVTLD
jgi:CO/xanthine dehydrogenase Mo-binding subunit